MRAELGDLLADLVLSGLLPPRAQVLQDLVVQPGQGSGGGLLVPGTTDLQGLESEDAALLCDGLGIGLGLVGLGSQFGRRGVQGTGLHQTRGRGRSDRGGLCRVGPGAFDGGSGAGGQVLRLGLTGDTEDLLGGRRRRLGSICGPLRRICVFLRLFGRLR